jgi:hypothetical protein
MLEHLDHLRRIHTVDVLFWSYYEIRTYRRGDTHRENNTPLVICELLHLVFGGVAIFSPVSPANYVISS